MRCDSLFRPGLFNGRVPVVSSGSGIGGCIAHELVAPGAAVAIVGRTELPEILRSA
jgi:citronellol/citronellal dehydrogenase